MKIPYYLLLFMLLLQTSNAIIINEIMADPFADETLNEWVELYNDGNAAVNVSNWYIGDNTGNDTIQGGLYNNEGTIIPAFGYAIITDDATRVYNNFNASNDAIRLYADDASIGNGLGNDGEAIYVYDKSYNLIDKKTYNETTEGLSWSYANNSLFKSNPTPGFANDESLLSGCDYAVEIILAKTVFDNSSDFSFKMRASKISGSSTNFTLMAKIEGLDGRLIREYSPFTNEEITKQRTTTEFTPNLDEGKSYFMGSNVTVQCNDTNENNNFDERVITIKGKPLQEESSINIGNILDLGADKKAKFGQTIRVSMSTYKGNTNKKSVALWVESDKGKKLSKQSSASLEEKYTNYSFTMPVQIIPNCDNGFKDDEYILKADGLDDKDEEEIKIEGLTDSSCEEKLAESKLASDKFGFEIKEFNKLLIVGKVFNTKILFDNNNNLDMPIKVWSYVYRGSKSYSGDREANKREFILKANSLQEVELENMVEHADAGAYKFKVVVNKNSQKTNDDVAMDILIAEEELSTSENVNLKSEPGKSNGNMATANNVLMPHGLVYESTTEKAKNLIPVFLIALSVLLNIILIWKR